MAESKRRSQRSAPDSDPAGLLGYPRPSLAVDVAVLTVAPAESIDSSEPSDDDSPDRTLALSALLLRRTTEPEAGRWSLPGGFVHERETLREAVLRVLEDKCGIAGLDARQLHVFDEPDRDERGWVVSVAHLVVVAHDEIADAMTGRDDLTLAAVVAPRDSDLDTTDGVDQVVLTYPQGQAGLPFDHDEIVSLAVNDLRERYREVPDPERLLGGPFTLLELRRVHEAILGITLQKDTFRRNMTPHLDEILSMAVGLVGRPARLFVPSAERRR